MRILLAGGGTGGPVAPILAVVQKIRAKVPDAEFLFVGTKNGPEKAIVESAGFNYQGITAGKLRRYLSIQNVLDIFVFISSLFVALRIVNKFNPDVVFSVGGFVAVPVSLVAKLKGKKVVIHQQDAEIGLANKLIKPFADVITTAFEETVKEFSTEKKVEWVGNPVREEFFDSSLPYKEFFKLNEELPVLVIVGGASGARQINEVVAQAIPELVKSHQVVHLTGFNKASENNFTHRNYHVYEILGKEWPTIMKMAHMIICRAGLSTIAELSVLGKVAIVVPMPDSHQERNGEILKQKAAAVVLDTNEFNSENLIRVVNSLKFNIERQKLLSSNISSIMPKDSAEKLANIIIQSIK